MTIVTTPHKINVESQAIQAKKAAKILSALTEKEKNEALTILADKLEAEYKTILKANELDLANGSEQNFEEAFMDRLSLTKERIYDFSKGLREVVELEDPTGDVISNWTLENGLTVEQVRVPLGVIGMIYEARPNVTVDATGLALKSGNAIVLKGGSSAINTNKVIVDVIHQGLEETKIPKEAVQFIASTDRAATKQLFTMKEHIDVLIPRGGGALINAVVNNATVPVLETGVGNCHIYIDCNADVNKALSILINAKTDRPAVCNAAETVIIHEDWFEKNVATLLSTLNDHGVSIRGDERVLKAIPGAKRAEEKDWAEEFLGLTIAMKIVKNVEEAIEHIDRYGTKHSEAIITEDKDVTSKFFKQVDAAALYHNASTRFTDGGALGFGAEIGISTQKLHARGPMGLPALTTSKYLMTGNGHIR